MGIASFAGRIGNLLAPFTSLMVRTSYTVLYVNSLSTSSANYINAIIANASLSISALAGLLGPGSDDAMSIGFVPQFSVCCS